MKVTLTNNSCECDIFIDREAETGRMLASVRVDMKTEEGVTDTVKLLETLEVVCANKKVNEIWMPTVISKDLGMVLEKCGYKHGLLGEDSRVDPPMKVMGYKKLL